MGNKCISGEAGWPGTACDGGAAREDSVRKGGRSQEEVEQSETRRKTKWLTRKNRMLVGFDPDCLRAELSGRKRRELNDQTGGEDLR
jgi:hypothetical protein